MRLRVLLFFLACAVLRTSAGDFITLPVPPDTLSRERKAEWFVEHYWDSANFDQATNEEVEQAFVDYVTILQIAPHRAFVAIPRLDVLATLADKYLNDSKSPLYNDTLYLHFVRHFVGDSLPDFPLLHEGRRLMFSQAVAKCLECPGKSENLDCPERAAPPSPPVLLYDPDCDDCHTLISRLSEAATPCVIAVSLNPEAALPKLPAGWFSCKAADDSPYKLLPIRRLPFLWKFPAEMFGCYGE